MTHVHVHSMHTHRLQQQEYTYILLSVRPTASAPTQWGRMTKPQKKFNELKHLPAVALRFSVAVVFPWVRFVRPFVRGRPHSSHKTSYIKLELRLETP